MDTTQTDRVIFVTRLETLRERDDRRALAALRRTAGRPLAESLGALPYLAAYLPDSRPATADALLIAGLFALHPQAGGSGNLGDSLHRADVSERRVGALLACHRDDLAYPLRSVVTLCRSAGIAVDWHRLYRDLRGWGHPDAYVQVRWAQAYWGERLTDDVQSVRE